MPDKYCPFCDALIKENEEETPSDICWNCKREINPEGLDDDISPEEIQANGYKESFIVMLIRFIALCQ